MAVSPLLLAALKAYSTWYSRPSGLKMVLQAGRWTGSKGGRWIAEELRVKPEAVLKV